MSARVAAVVLAAAAMALAATLAGCGGGGDDTASVDHTASSRPSSPPVGGPQVRPSTPPRTPMDELERPIAARLADQVRGEGLTLSYLRCPHWDGTTPQSLTCQGYFDGVTADVRVRLTSSENGAVTFDATLADGVIATRNLVEQLQGQGYRHVRCGSTPAYPARVGMRLVCSVHKHGDRGFVVARVTDRSGAVDIRRY